MQAGAIPAYLYSERRNIVKECFVERRFSKNSIKLIEQANSIIDDYENQGYQLTLRQLYYQFVSRDLIANTQKNYKNLGSVINDGRLAGLIDWNAIEDRTRHIRHSGGDNSNVKNIMMSSIKYGYNLDKWINSDHYIEVWVEKDALISIVEDVCRKYEVACLSCRGYVSQSEMYQAAERFKEEGRNGKFCTLIHLGDHDPSGIDMTRDIDDRLNNIFNACVDIDRIALSQDQIKEYSPPPNPAKTTDSRYSGYRKIHGNESWELDALEPSVIEQLITSNILYHIDIDDFERIKKQEKKDILKYLKKIEGIEL